MSVKRGVNRTQKGKCSSLAFYKATRGTRLQIALVLPPRQSALHWLNFTSTERMTVSNLIYRTNERQRREQRH